MLLKDLRSEIKNFLNLNSIGMSNKQGVKETELLEAEGKLMSINLVVSMAPSLARRSASSLNLTPI